MKVRGAIPGTQCVVSEENTAVNENNRFTERFNFELAFNLPLSELFFKSISIGNWRDGPCNAIFNHGNVACFCRIRVELNVFSGYLKSFAQRFVSIF